MTEPQNFNIRQNNNNNTHLKNLKSGSTASDLNLQNGEVLSLFNIADKNQNGKLDNILEVSLFNAQATEYNKLADNNLNLTASEMRTYENLPEDKRQEFYNCTGRLREVPQRNNVQPCQSDNLVVVNPRIEAAEMKADYDRQNFINECTAEARRRTTVKRYDSNQLRNMNTVVLRMQNNYKVAQGNFDQQMKKDTWAADVADAIAHVWNNDLIELTGNTADYVRRDLQSYRRSINYLNKGITDGDFEGRFLSTFGVNYNPEKIKKYETKKAEYEDLSAKVHAATVFRETMAPNISKIAELEEQLQKEKAAIARGEFVQSTTEHTLALQKALFVEKMQDVMGIERTNKLIGEDDYKQYLEVYNKTNETLRKISDENYIKFLKKFGEVAYARADAYGTKNDIIKRVDDYNSSQDSGAACVKFVTNVALAAAAPTSIVGAVVYGAGTSVALDVADAATSETINFDLGNSLKKGILNGVFCGGRQALVNAYSGQVASAVTASSLGQAILNHVGEKGTKLTNLLIKELVSKETVKTPGYALETVTNTVLGGMSGIQDQNVNLSRTQKEESMTVVSEAMLYMITAKDNGLLQKEMTQEEVSSLLNEHITTSLKDNTTFNNWVSNNRSQYQKMLDDFVKQNIVSE